MGETQAENTQEEEEEEGDEAKTGSWSSATNIKGKTRCPRRRRRRLDDFVSGIKMATLQHFVKSKRTLWVTVCIRYDTL